MKSYIIWLFLFLFSFINISYWQNIQNIQEWQPSIWITKIKWLWREIQVDKIPEWKMQIYKKNNIWYFDFLILNVIDNLECWREDWWCVTKSDWWPFQINQIHKEDFRKALNMIKNKEWEKLFEEQMLWTYTRIKNMDQKICAWVKSEIKRAECQLINHNGNNRNWFKFNYWKAWVKIYNVLHGDYNLRYYYDLIDNNLSDYWYIPYTVAETKEIKIENLKLKKQLSWIKSWNYLITNNLCESNSCKQIYSSFSSWILYKDNYMTWANYNIAKIWLLLEERNKFMSEKLTEISLYDNVFNKNLSNIVKDLKKDYKNKYLEKNVYDWLVNNILQYLNNIYNQKIKLNNEFWDIIKLWNNFFTILSE